MASRDSYTPQVEAAWLIEGADNEPRYMLQRLYTKGFFLNAVCVERHDALGRPYWHSLTKKSDGVTTDVSAVYKQLLVRVINGEMKFTKVELEKKPE